MEKRNLKPRIIFDWRNIGIVLGSGIVILSIIAAIPYTFRYINRYFPRLNSQDAEINSDELEEDLSTASASANMMDNLKIEDIKEGNGAIAGDGDEVSVHYTGTLTNGKKFDSSVGGEPFKFKLGAGDVIQGWDLGVIGMKVGGIRKLTIPSELGYGERGAGSSIPPNSTLIFEIELLNVN